jgi:hypothetical protein
MQIEVHQRQAARARDQFLAVIDAVPELPSQVTVDRAALGLGDEPLVSRDQEPAGAAGRVADGELAVRPRIGLKTTGDGFDQQAGSEVLTRAFLTLAGSLL